MAGPSYWFGKVHQTYAVWTGHSLDDYRPHHAEAAVMNVAMNCMSETSTNISHLVIRRVSMRICPPEPMPTLGGGVLTIKSTGHPWTVGTIDEHSTTDRSLRADAQHTKSYPRRSDVTERTILRGGTLITMDSAFPSEFKGDLLIEDGAIAAVAPRIETSDSSCRSYDMTNHIILPGMVDTHRHIWQTLFRYAGADWNLADYGNAMWRLAGPRQTPEDTYLAIRLGIAEALDAGVTQLFDWNHNLNSPEHADAAVAAHRSSGARMILGYGQSAQAWAQIAQSQTRSSIEPPSRDIFRLAAEYYSSDASLTTLALAARGPECSPLSIVADEQAIATELAIRTSVHVGNGRWGAMGPISKVRELGCLTEHITWVHCCSLADSELDLIADSGGSVSVAPELEQHMGHGRPAVRRCLDRGLPPSLSVDTCTNVSGDLFAVMRATLASARADRHARDQATGAELDASSPSVYEALQFATIRGAQANGLAHRTGSLTPGKDADVVAIDTLAPNLVPVVHAAASVVMGAHPGNVDLVFVRGQLVKAGGRILDLDLAALAAEARERSERLLHEVGGTTGGWRPPLTDRAWGDTHSGR